MEVKRWIPGAYGFLMVVLCGLVTPALQAIATDMSFKAVVRP